ncbi:pilus assembly protein PilZ [Marinobacter salinus]|uniref:Pilus assembly protein PilZ n=1 Tax=Marinobacter salinus TaxID=1874317 RepID=A0A1D9GI18_9GAMM|nr:PilZ domain-containing protein [Marinobacter salinus]AOY87287.1 pilus assembly protein PilZ [Marinobacter salinus]
MKDYSEKRDFHRMQVNSEIEITDSSGETFRGTCRDLSATGMQLFVKRPVSIGEELTTVLHSNGDQIPPLETVCEVVRCDEEGDGYLLGTTINEVT